MQQTLGNPSFRHETALFSMEAPPGFVLAAHPGRRGLHFRLWAIATGESRGYLYWPALSRKYLLSPTRPEVLISHEEKLIVYNLEDNTSTERPLPGVANWAISPGGNQLVLASNSSLRGFSSERGFLWESQDASCLQFPIVFSPDGSHFVLRNDDQLEIFRSEDGTKIFKWPRRKGDAWALDSHGRIFVGDRESGLLCWDLASGLLQAFHPESDPRCLLLSPCERFLAALAVSGQQQLFRTDTLEIVHRGSSVGVQAFTSDGRLLSSGGDHGVSFLSLADLVEPFDAPKQSSRAHSGHRRPVSGLAWLPDGSLISSGWDGRVLRWESGSSTELVRLAAPIDVMRVSPDGSLLALGGSNLGVVLWDLRANQSLGLASAGHSLTIWERGKGARDFDGWLTNAGIIGFSKDGSKLVAVLGYDYLATWDVDTGRLLYCEEKPTELYYASGGLVDPRGFLYVAMGLAVGSELTQYNWRTGEKKNLWKLPLELTTARIAGWKERLFIACSEGNLSALDSTSGRLVDQVKLPEECLCLHCSTNGMVIIGTARGGIFFWRENETLRGPFRPTHGGLWSTALALSPCDRTIAVGHGNGVVSLAEMFSL